MQDASACVVFGALNKDLPRPPNVPLLRALRSLLDCIWDLLKGSWGVLVEGFRTRAFLVEDCCKACRQSRPGKNPRAYCRDLYRIANIAVLYSVLYSQ